MMNDKTTTIAEPQAETVSTTNKLNELFPNSPPSVSDIDKQDLLNQFMDKHYNG
jgi:hypothetical protein